MINPNLPVSAITYNGVELPIVGGSSVDMGMITLSHTWTANYEATATTTISGGTAAVNATTFKTSYPNAGTYTFVSDGTNWSQGGSTVDLATVGITYTGTPALNDTITVTVVVGSPYTQTVTVTGATVDENSKVDIQPEHTLITRMVQKGTIGLYIVNNMVNNNPVLTCYAVGEIPNDSGVDITNVQVSVTEVTA